jgi:hypothetical protein
MDFNEVFIASALLMAYEESEIRQSYNNMDSSHQLKNTNFLKQRSSKLNVS